MIPSPYERQRPRTIVASTSAKTRRPAATSRHPRAEHREQVTRAVITPARARRAATAARGGDRQIWRRAVRSRHPARTVRAAGTQLPVPPCPSAARGSTGSTTTAARTSSSVAAPISTSPGARSARVAQRCSRVAGHKPFFRARHNSAGVDADSPVDSRVPAAHPASRSPRGTARSASSSCITGTPKTPITASPMNFSTDPPCARECLHGARSSGASNALSASGSVDSPRAVEPTTSQNRTETVFGPRGWVWLRRGGLARAAVAEPRALRVLVPAGSADQHRPILPRTPSTCPVRPTDGPRSNARAD